MTLLGAVLTGGLSTRMGQDKADVLISDDTMLTMVGTAVRSVAPQSVLLGPERDGWDSWPDSVHAHGPLAGIATVLARTDRDHVLVVAVDHPFVRPETLRRLVSLAADIPVVPVDNHGVPQVTCALYPRGVGPAAESEAGAGGSIQSLLDRVSFRAVAPDEWRPWGEDGRSWYSVDDIRALEEGLARYVSAPPQA